MKKVILAIVVPLILALAGIFVFPFGIIPKFASPNCGPEYWRWLGRNFNSGEDVVSYVRVHEIELLSGTCVPRLDPIPSGMVVSRMDVAIDWQSITSDILVVHRPLYTLYILNYHHPACLATQSYTLQLTSYGLASLYGCCGI